jgi:hypothetical protein
MIAFVKDSLPKMEIYAEKLVIVQACQIHDDFFVDVGDARLNGKSGDYLVKSSTGTIYPCSRLLFESRYEKHWVTTQGEKA